MNRKTESISANKLKIKKKKNKVFQGVDNDPVIRRRHWKPSSRSFFSSSFLYTPLFKRNKINKYKIYFEDVESNQTPIFTVAIQKIHMVNEGRIWLLWTNQLPMCMYILEKAFTFFLRGSVRYGCRGLFVLLEFLGCVLCDTAQRGKDKKEKECCCWCCTLYVTYTQHISSLTSDSLKRDFS